MKIQKGIVQYKDRDDIECLYGITDDGKAYYFLDATDTTRLANGNRIASTVLVEAIDPMVKASNVGVISEDGIEVIPFNNRSIRPITANAILVEPAQPISQSVIEANNLRTDPLSATQLVSTPAIIKEKINAKMGGNGRYIFNDQFAEATICDIDGNNKLSNEFFSFIGMDTDKLYLAKNTQDTDIKEFSLSTMEYIPAENEVINQEVLPEKNIDVTNVEVPQEIVETEINNQEVEDNLPVENVNQGFDMNDIDTVPLQDNQMVEENTKINNEEVGEEISIPTEEETLVNETQPSEEISSVDDSTNSNFDFGINDNAVENTIEEDNSNIEEDINVNEDYTPQDSELDNMVNYDEDYDNRFEDYSKVETDKIEDYDDDYIVNDFDETEKYRDDTKGKARVVTGLINVVKTKTNENDKLRKNLKTETEKSKMKDEKIDILTSQNRAYKAEVSKLESRNDMLEEELRETKRKIDSLEREVSSLRQSESELNRVIEEAEALIDNNRNYDDEDYYYTKAA